MKYLKGNQFQFYQDIRLYLSEIYEKCPLNRTFDTWKTIEKNRGRLGTRLCIATGQIDWLDQRYRWKHLRSIILIVTSRVFKGKKTVSYRFYISSLVPNAQIISRYIRKHWSIENHEHRNLDLFMDSDRSIIRDLQKALNFSIFKDFALHLLQNNCINASLKEKRIANDHQIEILLKTLIKPRV